MQLGPYRIHCFVGGTGEPLVLVHGLGSRALDFAPLMVALVREHRVFAGNPVQHRDEKVRMDAGFLS